MVFSSKANTPYTEMFLTHIDERGNDSPPILIENAKAANRAVNIPEFVNVAYDDFEKITVPAVYHYENFSRGNELARLGRHQEAIAEFEQALAGQKQEWRIQDWRIHDSLSKSLLQVGRYEEAFEHTVQSLEINPYNPEMHANLGYLYTIKGDYAKALEHLGTAIRLYPTDPRAWYSRGTIHAQLGDQTSALDDFSEAIRLDPEHAEAFAGRGMIRQARGDAAGATADLDAAIRLDPGAPAPRYFRGLLRKEAGDLSGAAEDLSRALEATPPGTPQRAEIERLYRQVRDELARG
jgi:tetratricopeptide (TPR) repeat protein